MITLYQSTAPDGLKIRLIERATKPRFVITTEMKQMAGFHPIGNDRDHAIRAYLRHIERASASAA